MTVQTAMAELSRGIYLSLSSDPTLSAMVTGIFNSVEEDLVFPYVTFSEPISTEFSTKVKFGEELSIVVSAWSIYSGNLEAINILNQCLKALAKRMTFTGFTIRKVKIDSIRVFDDADPRIRHGVVRIVYTIQNN